jgi:NADH-quinone oxidoreductase subunit M
MLWLYQRTMFGKNENPKNQDLLDLNGRELATLIPLIIVAFWIGLYPTSFTRFLEKPVNKLVEAVQPEYFKGEPRNAQNAKPVNEVSGDIR